MYDLILASASPQRRRLLHQIGLRVKVEVSQIDEKMDLRLSPQEFVCQIALAKAEAVGRRLGEGLILGADTIVVCQGEILGKPGSAEKAKEMLKKLSGATPEVVTGLALLDAKTGRSMVDKVITEVTMKRISDAQIAGYVATGEPLDKSGALAIDGLGAKFIVKINGCYSNVVGLPLGRLMDMIAEFSYKPEEDLDEEIDLSKRVNLLASARNLFFK